MPTKGCFYRLGVLEDSFKGGIENGTDTDMDIDSDIAVPMDWVSSKRGSGLL